MTKLVLVILAVAAIGCSKKENPSIPEGKEPVVTDSCKNQENLQIISVETVREVHRAMIRKLSLKLESELNSLADNEQKSLFMVALFAESLLESSGQSILEVGSNNFLYVFNSIVDSKTLLPLRVLNYKNRQTSCESGENKSNLDSK